MMKKIRKAFKHFYQYMLRGGVTYLDLKVLDAAKQLSGKTALITGGNSGIGKAIASCFLDQGAEKVVIVGRNKESLSATQEELGDKLDIVQGDLSEVTEIERILKEGEKIAACPFDILVNNAGVYTTKSIAEMDATEWDRIMDTNVRGLYFMSLVFVQSLLVSNRSGKIINISSNRSMMGDTGPYGPSKRAVNSITEGFAKAYMGKGIIVNGIAPGVVASAINGVKPEENLFSEVNAHQRIIRPEEIAQLALFLASDVSNSIIGQTIVIDGGTILQ